jgi:hypothetical protein
MFQKPKKATTCPNKGYEIGREEMYQRVKKKRVKRMRERGKKDGDQSFSLVVIPDDQARYRL